MRAVCATEGGDGRGEHRERPNTTKQRKQTTTTAAEERDAEGDERWRRTKRPRPWRVRRPARSDRVR
eukprot:15198545-Alexandrium_andersonii.AAC.1